MSVNIDTETRIRTLYRFPTFIFLFVIFIVSILMTAFGLTKEKAEEIMGESGRSFTKEKKE